MSGPWRQRSSVWQADIASILLLVLFVLVIFGLEAFLQPQFTPTTLLLTGILMALVPAVIWLTFFSTLVCSCSYFVADVYGHGLPVGQCVGSDSHAATGAG